MPGTRIHTPRVLALGTVAALVLAASGGSTGDAAFASPDPPRTQGRCHVQEARLEAGSACPFVLEAAPVCWDALFFDNFEDGNDVGWTALGGTWQVIDGVYGVRVEGSGNHAYTTAGCPDWASYRLDVDVRLVAGIDRAVNVRWADPNSPESDRYRIDFRHWGEVTVHRILGGAAELLASTPHPSEIGTWNRIGIEACRNRIRVFIDGASVLEVVDDSIPRGAIALEGHPGIEGLDEVEFDNVHVAAVPEFVAVDERVARLEALVQEQSAAIEYLRLRVEDQDVAMGWMEEVLRDWSDRGREFLRCLRDAGIPCNPLDGH
jgi:hypothetical protein